MKENFAQVKVVLEDGSSSTFLGIRVVARPAFGDGDKLPFPVPEDDSEVIAELVGKALGSLNLPTWLSPTDNADGEILAVDKAFISLFTDKTGTETSYFAVEFADRRTLVIFYEGTVYLCNENGETVESFNSWGRKRRSGV